MIYLMGWYTSECVKQRGKLTLNMSGTILCAGGPEKKSGAERTRRKLPLTFSLHPRCHNPTYSAQTCLPYYLRFLLLWRDTMTMATLIIGQHLIRAGLHFQKFRLLSWWEAWLRANKHSAGDAESSASCSEGKQKTSF